MWLPGLVKVSNRFAPAAPPTLLSSPDQTIVSGTPFSLELITSEPCLFSLVGEVDDDLFDLGGNTVGAVALDHATPIDVGANNVYNWTLRITSIATGLYTDVPMSLTVTTEGTDALDFDLSASSVSEGATVGTLVGNLEETETGVREHSDFSLSPSTVSDAAVAGTSVGDLN